MRSLDHDPAKSFANLWARCCVHWAFEKTLPLRAWFGARLWAYFRTYFNRHFREPVVCVSDSMTEDAAVFG